MSLHFNRNLKKHRILKVFLINTLVFFCLYSPLYAKDLGVISKIYPISEIDLLDYIKEKIEFMQKNGRWEKIQNELKIRVENHTDRPFSLTTINKTMINKSWSSDPSVYVPYNLKDENGHIFAKAGTLVNPLSIRSLHTALVFYDGDDKDQVEWVKAINIKYSGQTKLILINGSISQQERIFHQPIYFDQQAKLTNHFNIAHVPAVVFQEGLHLKIMEIAI
ncbi:MAG: type-F conjugative transfer system protein TraW [Gammaproteobacteria bacterium]